MSVKAKNSLADRANAITKKYQNPTEAMAALGIDPEVADLGDQMAGGAAFVVKGIAADLAKMSEDGDEKQDMEAIQSAAETALGALLGSFYLGYVVGKTEGQDDA